MGTKTSKGKEIKTPGPDHPITISPAEGKVRVTVAGRIVAESAQALRLDEKGISTCLLRAAPIGGSKSEYAVWTYEKPYEAVASIKEYLAFYPSRIDAIDTIS